MSTFLIFAARYTLAMVITLALCLRASNRPRSANTPTGWIPPPGIVASIVVLVNRMMKTLVFLIPSPAPRILSTPTA
jgi:hypothetical protein